MSLVKSTIFNEVLVKSLVEIFGDSMIRDFICRFKSIDLEEIIFNDEVLSHFLVDKEKEFLTLILKLRFKYLIEGVAENA